MPIEAAAQQLADWAKAKLERWQIVSVVERIKDGRSVASCADFAKTCAVLVEITSALCRCRSILPISFEDEEGLQGADSVASAQPAMVNAPQCLCFLRDVSILIEEIETAAQHASPGRR